MYLEAQIFIVSLNGAAAEVCLLLLLLACLRKIYIAHKTDFLIAQYFPVLLRGTLIVQFANDFFLFLRMS